MILGKIFRRAARSLMRPSAAGIFLLLIFGHIPVSVKTQCPQCTGHYIKTVDGTTGECISCFPCPPCEDGYTSSVPCGLTVPFGTDIKCVLIQSSPAAVITKKSAQTRHLTATLVTISSSAKKLIITPVTSISPVAVPATSSSTSARSSSKGPDIKKRKSENLLPLEEWEKNTMIYIFSGIFLVIISVAIVCRILKCKSSKHLQLQPVNQANRPTQPASSVPPLPDIPQDNETCNISAGTVTFTGTCHNDHTSVRGDGNQRSQPSVAQGSSCRIAGGVNVVQPNNQLVSPITDGMEQGRAFNWSVLSQRHKYQAKVLEMPFPLLYKICLTLDIPRADGNDVRMLAFKLEISVNDLAILKQAAITQHPDNSYYNSITYVVLTKKSLLTVEDFVAIMKDIERDDIISVINN